MNQIADEDIITSATPLETKFCDVHPRLHAFENDFKRLRRLAKSEPYISMLKRVQGFADSFPMSVAGKKWTTDLRTTGDLISSLALLWKINQNKKDFTRLRDLMCLIAVRRNWDIDLVFGHLGYSMALAWDWLYHDLQKADRDAVADAMMKKGEFFFNAWADYDHFAAFAYTWNHMAVPLTGLTALGCALYGERPHVARWVKMAMEKTRLMTEALAHDGLSPEGTAYGQYHAEYLARTATLLRDLAGVDFISGSEWWRNYALASLYLTYPRQHWRNKQVFFMLGDADRKHWLGPDPVIRLCAGIFNDSLAQWFAHELHFSDSGTDYSAFLNLLWHDPDVKRTSPKNLPPCRLFTDKDIAVMRSGWDGRESVMVFTCGPHSGRRNRRYSQNISGGHQHPIAGAITLFAQGDILLAESGYPRKRTAYENTLLINGRGQIGEGSAWFEDLEFRRGHPEPSMSAAGQINGMDYAIGDATNAYPKKAGLKRFIRHVYALAPDHWLIADEVEASRPARFSILFHGDKPFCRQQERVFRQQGERGSLLLQALAPNSIQIKSRQQNIERIGHPAAALKMGLLEISTAKPARKALFLTHLHAYSSKQTPTAALALQKSAGRIVLVLNGKGINKTFLFKPAPGDPAVPALQHLKRAAK